MSLVGSLEDLALGDILQIVSLARKSGLLLLRSEEGDGRIVVSEGLVRAAYMKGEPEDLPGVILAAGMAEPELVNRAVAYAEEAGVDVAQVLSERTGLSPDRLDCLRREHVERVVVRMFGWDVGEFSFDVREEMEERDKQLALPVGVNAQFLSMEAARIGDERGEAAASAAGAHDFVFSGESNDDTQPHPHPDPTDPHEFLAVTTAAAYSEISAPWRAASDEGEPATEEYRAYVGPEEDERSDPTPMAVMETLPEQQPMADLETPPDQPPMADLETPPEQAPVAVMETPPDAAPVAVMETRPDPAPVVVVETRSESAPIAVVDRTPDSAPVAAVERFPEDARPAGGAAVPLVVIDRNLRALEWIKSVAADAFARVHIFQHSEGGIGRIRQYLVRGDLPTVLVSTDVPPDSLSDSSDPGELLRRLRAQAPRMPILVMHMGEQPDDPGVAAADALVSRPPIALLNDRRRRAEVEEAARSLRAALLPWSRRDAARERGPAKPARKPADDAALERLREISQKLRDPSTLGDVLTLVMEFAAESFERVAMFMVRDDEAVGIAQLGLEAAGGPDETRFRELRIPLLEPACFQEVVATRRAQRLTPDDDGDRQLTGRLGNGHPAEIYVAPIESGGRVAAILYADNLPGAARLRDVAALTVVLHEAGLALDRALLERALAEAEGEGPRA